MEFERVECSFEQEELAIIGEMAKNVHELGAMKDDDATYDE